MERLRVLKMKWGRAVLISLPFFALSLFWQAYDYAVPLILSRHYRLGTTVYSLVMSIDNVVALVFLPLFGILSDRMTGRLGRRTPLILTGTMGGILGLFLMSMEDSRALSGDVRIAAFLAFLLITVFFMSLYRSPSAALVADCFIRPQRTMANAVLNVMGGLGGVLFGVVGHLMITERSGVPIFQNCLTFVMLVMLASTVVYLLFMRENRFIRDVEEQNLRLGLLDEKTDPSSPAATHLDPDEKKSLVRILFSVLLIYMGYNGFHTHYTNYLVTYLQQSASWTGPYLLEVGVGMLMMIPAAFVTAGLGRKKSCLIGMAVCVIGYFGLSTVTAEHPTAIYLWFFLAAISFPLFGINLGPMVLELARDSDSGRYMGYYYVAVTAAQIVTPTLASLFINVHGYRIIGIYGGVCTLVAFISLMPVRHGDVKLSFRQAFRDSAAIDD